MIELKNITKAFRRDIHLSKKNVLNNVNLKIERGKVYGLFGKNGSGKTTILKIIMNLISPDIGQVNLKGKDLLYKDVCFSSEKMDYFPDFTCNDFFLMIKDIQNIPRKLFDERKKYFIKKFDLKKSLEVKLRYFSQGMLKKASFIACSLSNPKIMLLDEPFAGLDLDSRKALKNEIEKFKDEGGGVLLTSHMFEEVSILIDEWYYIKEGKILDNSFDHKSILSGNNAQFESYHIEVLSPKGNVKFSEEEYTKVLNKYIFKVSKNKKEKFIKDVLDQGCKVESVVLNKHKLGDYFSKLENG